MKKIIITTLISAVLLSVNGQDVSKGYKALEKSDHAKAKEIFEKNQITQKESPAICFGLMVVYADKTSTFYNIISAWDMGRIVEKNINQLTPEEKLFIGEYFTSTEVRKSNWPINKKILQAVGAVEASLIKYIREENNLQMVNEIIEKFPDFRFYQNVVHIRNQLEFRKYEKQNTLDGYLEFINKFPEASQVSKAAKYRDKLALDKAKSINTVEAYELYLKNFPNSAEYNTAIKLRNSAAFALAKQKNTIEAFEKFITTYNDALEISDAKKIQKQLLYDYAKRIQTLEAYDEFIKKYPDGSHYIDIFNLKTLELGKKTLSNNSFAISNIQWTRSFDNKKFIETAGGIAVSPSNQYIIAGNTLQSDSLYDDAWIIKVDADGKMIWNKIIGGLYNDSVFKVSINTSNEILALGYTNLGIDSASKEPWIFKLDADGKKIWNRSLGKWTVTSMVVSLSDEIIFGGYERNDSAINHYKIMVINNSGKKLWSRTYTSPGEINSLITDAEDNIIIAGSKWCYKISPKGYLKWENQFAPMDSISCAAALNDGNYMFLGNRDSTKLILSKISKDGSVAWIKEIANYDKIMCSKMIQLSDGLLMATGKASTGEIMLLMNTEGKMIKSIQVPFGTTIHDITIDKLGNNLFQFTASDNIFVIKTTASAF